MRSTLLTALVAGVVFVAGCGGGSNSNVRPDAVVEPPPIPLTPVTTSQTTLQGTSEVDIIDYLKDQASGGPWGPEGQTWQRTPKMPLWMQRPTVRVESSAAPELHRMTAKAVDLINDWLPLEHRMIMGTPTELRTTSARDPADGVIHVSFGFDREGGTAIYDPIRDDSDPSDVPTLRAVVVGVNPNSVHRTFGLIVHELVHAVSIPGHVSEHRHPTSIMPDEAYRGGPLPDEASLPRLPRIDGEALMTAYEVFNDGHTPDEINPTSLGPWAETLPALHGEVTTDGGTARFGVEYRTQWTRAWDEGPVPATPLARSGLTGTATWTGEMIGYTDAGTAVEGDAGITVDIADMDGTAAFTDLMAGGASWGPDLSTRIDVDGNHIESTQGGSWVGFDAQFRGAGHKAVTGVFRWEDTATGNLTAAFGAARD